MAIDILGVDEYIDCGSGATLDNLRPITVAFWVNPDAIDTTTWFIIKDSGAGDGWILRCDTTTKEKINWRQGTSANEGQWTTGSVLSVGAWQHIALSYNGSALGTAPVMYYNGASQVVTRTVEPTGTIADDSPRALRIGGGGPAGTYLDGKMEDVRIFNRVLTANEIATLAAGYRGPLGGEAGWWPMLGANGIANWEGTALAAGNTIRDESGNGNTGTPSGDPVGYAGEAPRMPVWTPTRLGELFFTQATAYRMRHWRRGRDMSDSVSEQIA